jgi:hypothetical protein
VYPGATIAETGVISTLVQIVQWVVRFALVARRSMRYALAAGAAFGAALYVVK